MLEATRGKDALVTPNVVVAETWTYLRRRKLRIGEALAFDGNFAAAGFVELRP